MHLLSPAEWVLVVVVTAQAVGLAYVHSPRAKSLLYMLPLPFSCGVTATGNSVDATHLVGMMGVWGFVWVVWYLHVRRGMHIVAADVTAIILYIAGSLLLSRLIPPAGSSGELAVFGIVGAAGILLSIVVGLSRHPHEPGHRSSMSVPLKAVLVLIIILGMVMSKEWMRGFMPAFPIASTFAVYEARHSLRTLAVRFSIFIIGFVPMAFLLRALLPQGPGIPTARYTVPLLLGWAVYIPIYRGLDYVFTRRAGLPAPEAV